MDYKQKYLKYRQKYLDLKRIIGGVDKYDCKPIIKSNKINDFCEKNIHGEFKTLEECSFSSKCSNQWILKDKIIEDLLRIPMSYKTSSFKPTRFEPIRFEPLSYKPSSQERLRLSSFKSMSSEPDEYTPLNMSEYAHSKSVELVNERTYNPDELRGFFTHGIHNNIETLIDIIRDRIILPRSKTTSKVNTLTGLSVVDTNTISLSTISLIYPLYKVYGRQGISFITNRILDSELIRKKVNSSNEFLIKDLDISNTALLLDVELKTMKIKNVPLLGKLNTHSPGYKNVIKDKILFLIDEYKVADTDRSIIIEEVDIEKLKKIYFEIINKIFGERTFLDVVIDILRKYNVNIPIVFLNYS